MKTFQWNLSQFPDKKCPHIGHRTQQSDWCLASGSKTQTANARGIRSFCDQVFVRKTHSEEKPHEKKKGNRVSFYRKYEKYFYGKNEKFSADAKLAGRSHVGKFCSLENLKRKKFMENMKKKMK